MPVRRMDAKRVSNQALFRRVNERIRDLNEGFSERFDLEPRFICECPDLACTESLPVPMEDFRRIRDEPAWFVVSPAHVDFDLEKTVEDHGDYVIVAVPEELLPAGTEATPES
jgi:hypothetical protein